MSAGARIAAFGGLILAIFAVAVVVGRAIGPEAGTSAPAAHDEMPAGGHDGHDETAGGGDSPSTAAGDETAGAPSTAAGDETAGAPSTAAGEETAGAPPAAAGGERLRIVAGAEGTRRPAGTTRPFTFRVVDERGSTVRSFEVEQDRRLHLIVVRRDLRRFQHLHPRMGADGVWSVPLRLPDAGAYHAFADFVSARERHTIGLDLFVSGRFEPLELPRPSTTATADGYDVRLAERGGAGALRFEVRRDGAAVEDLQPYLGARGHLVMLRAGDLAYEHVHPLAGDELAFHIGDAAPGTYRLFLQFRHRDAVHTVAFTREVAP